MNSYNDFQKYLKQLDEDKQYYENQIVRLNKEQKSFYHRAIAMCLIGMVVISIIAIAMYVNL